MSHLGQSLPAVSIALSLLGNARKIVKATVDFAIYVIEQLTRVVKAYRKAVAELRRDSAPIQAHVAPALALTPVELRDLIHLPAS
jgi:hypothetical protein